MSTHDKMLREWIAKRIPGDLCGLQLGQDWNRVTMVNRVDTRAGSINTVARIDHADAAEAMATACLFAAAPALAAEVLRLRGQVARADSDAAGYLADHAAALLALGAAASRAEKAEAERDALRAAVRDFLDAPASCYGVALQGVVDALGNGR